MLCPDVSYVSKERYALRDTILSLGVLLMSINADSSHLAGQV
jgi:hypothetical protein